MTEDQKRDLTRRFEAAGLSVVQVALCSPATSVLFGVPEVQGARQVAEQWVTEQLGLRRRRECRNDALLKFGAWAAVTAAVVGLITLLVTIF